MGKMTRLTFESLYSHASPVINIPDVAKTRNATCVQKRAISVKHKKICQTATLVSTDARNVRIWGGCGALTNRNRMQRSGDAGGFTVHSDCIQHFIKHLGEVAMGLTFRKISPYFTFVPHTVFGFWFTCCFFEILKAMVILRMILKY